MAINPEEISTIRIDQLPIEPITLSSKIGHAIGTELKQGTINELVSLISTAIGTTEAVGFFPLSVTDGQQLPAVPENPSFFLCGAGTYLNINGYSNVVCTGELNVVMSLSDHWELAVEIPIVAELGVQTVTGSAVDNTDPQNPVINIAVSSVAFADLTDVPNSYVGQGGKIVKVKSSEDGLEFTAGGGGGSQDIDQTLANGSTALDKSMTLDSTPDDTFDISKTVLNPYGIDIYSKEVDVSQIIILGLRGADLSWTDGGNTSGIIPKRTGGGIGNIVNGIFSLPEQFVTEELEILASRQWTNAQIYTAKTEAEAYADGLFDTLVVADLLNRANHTGTQAISTISGLQTYINKINSGIVSTSEKTLTNTTSAQAIYDTDLNAEANCTYEIFGSADFTGLATIGSFLSFSLLGTATIDSFSVSVLAVKNTNNTSPNLTVVNSNGTQITNSAAISSARLIFFGTVRVSGAGTVKPSVAFSSATASMKVSANAKFSFNKIGLNTVTNY